MRVVVFGGAGFVGLNLAEVLLAEGNDVVLFDRTAPPEIAVNDFARLPGSLLAVTADIADANAVAGALHGAEGVVYGAAITSNAEREAAEPRRVLEVNLMGFLGVAEAARNAGTRRLINLSSAGAYGEAAFGSAPFLSEAATLPDPRTLYALTKFASERVGARIGELWGLDVRSVRLSAVFGPWERATGVRDTLSPPYQVMRAALRGEPVCFERADVRDWLYAPDVGRSVSALLKSVAPAHDLYNIGPGRVWNLVDWASHLCRHFPALDVSIDPARATITTHTPRQRQPLDNRRLEDDLGLGALTGLEASADHYAAWAQVHDAFIKD